MVEWYLFLPQVRLSVGDITERAPPCRGQRLRRNGFIDHLEAPGLPGESIWEAMAVATWVAAKTERLRIGHLVLCDAFRHPAVLAKQAVTLSDASGGRFDLGLGSGSWPAEFTRFDVGQQDPVARVQQLGRHLALIRQYWGDETKDGSDEDDAVQLPTARPSDTAGSGWQRTPHDGTRSQLRGLVEPAGQPPRSVAQAGPGSGKRRGFRFSR